MSGPTERFIHFECSITNAYGLKHFYVHLQRPDLFTTEQMGTNIWLSVGDVSKLRTMYGCDAPGQGRKKILLTIF